MRMFRELAFGEISLGSISFLYVMIYILLSKIPDECRVEYSESRFFPLIRNMFDKTRARGGEYGGGCIIQFRPNLNAIFQFRFQVRNDSLLC